MCIFYFGVLDPPRAFGHYFSHQSAVVSFANVISKYLLGMLIYETAIVANFPNKITVVKRSNWINDGLRFWIYCSFMVVLIFPKIKWSSSCLIEDCLLNMFKSGFRSRSAVWLLSDREVSLDMLLGWLLMWFVEWCYFSLGDAKWSFDYASYCCWENCLFISFAFYPRAGFNLTILRLSFSSNYFLIWLLVMTLTLRSR